MTDIAKLEALVTVDKSQYDRGMSDVESKAKKTGESSSNHLGGIGKTAFLAAGAGGVLALGAAFGDVMGDMMAGEKVAAQTDAVIKSTGGSAGVTAKSVNDLATAISMKSGQDDEAIQSGENMLLTFTNIRNEAGKGNDIFNQSTSILSDMSAAMGTDMSSQAIQLGKALNDPIKGISALSKVGVTFDAQQKAQIKTMMAAGNTAGAQAVILKELNKEFGGSAAAAGQTFSGTMSRVKMGLENAAEAGLTKLLPFLTQGANEFMKYLPVIQSFLQEGLDKIGPVFDQIGSAVQASMPIVRTVLTAVFGVIQNDIIPIVTRLATIMAQTWANISAVLQAHQPQIQQIMEGLGNIVHALATVFETVLLPIIKVVFEDILPPAVGVALTVLAAILDPVHAVGTAFDDIKTVISGVATDLVADVTGIKTGITGAFEAVKTWVSQHWPEIATLISGPFAPIVALATGAFGVRKAITDGMTDVKHAVSGAIDDVVGYFRDLPGRILGWATSVGSTFVTAMGNGLSGLGAMLKRLLVAPINAIIGAIDSIKIPPFSLSIDTHIPGVGTVGFSYGGSGNFFNIPKLAKGGIVTSPTLALIGEAGPEAVVPLDSSPFGRSGGDTHIHLDGPLTFLTGDRATARSFVESIREFLPEPAGV